MNAPVSSSPSRISKGTDAIEGSSAELDSTPEVPRIEPSDQKNLTLFFGLGGVSGVFTGSSVEAQIERLSLFAYHAKPCVRCGGDRVRNVGGYGWVSSKKKQRRVSQEIVAKLKAQGIIVRMSKSGEGLLPPLWDTQCGKCKGKGWIEPKRPVRANNTRAITARPTGSSKSGSGPSAGLDSTMGLLGDVDRRLSLVEAISHRAAEALLGWFGTPKDKGGRSIRALWHLTPPGKTLLRRNGLKLTAEDFFTNERAAQNEKPDANRASLFEEADRLAQELWDETQRLWDFVTRTSDPAEIAAALRCEMPVAAE